MANSSRGFQPTTYKNPDHFNIGGDKTVTVVVTFDVSEKADENTVLRCAADYLAFKANSGDHKTWGRSIEIKE